MIYFLQHYNTMSFCELCGNIVIPDVIDDKLIIHCERPGCNWSRVAKVSEYIIQTHTFVGSSHTEINPNILYDPCLKRVSMQCRFCETQQEIVVMRNDETLKRIFVCTKCKRSWELH